MSLHASPPPVIDAPRSTSASTLGWPGLRRTPRGQFAPTSAPTRTASGSWGPRLGRAQPRPLYSAFAPRPIPPFPPPESASGSVGAYLSNSCKSPSPFREGLGRECLRRTLAASPPDPSRKRRGYLLDPRRLRTSVRHGDAPSPRSQPAMRCPRVLACSAAAALSADLSTSAQSRSASPTPDMAPCVLYAARRPAANDDVATRRPTGPSRMSFPGFRPLAVTTRVPAVCANALLRRCSPAGAPPSCRQRSSGAPSCRRPLRLARR